MRVQLLLKSSQHEKRAAGKTVAFAVLMLKKMKKEHNIFYEATAKSLLVYTRKIQFAFIKKIHDVGGDVGVFLYYVDSAVILLVDFAYWKIARGRR